MHFVLLAIILSWSFRHVVSASVFGDPDISDQAWIFDMINVRPVWEQGIFGSGVRVRVNDQGIDTSHVEFAGRFDKGASCDLYEAPYDEEDDDFYQHGTMVASIIGAAGNNDGCSVGIAPNVTLSSCLATTTPEVDESATNGTWLAYKLDQMDISQNSYGSVPCIATGSYSVSKTFENVDTCPFRDRPREYIYQGEELTFDHPCDVCDFPMNDDVPNGCARAIYFHCALFYEWDKGTCTNHLDGLVRSGQCSFFSEDKTVVESLERGATKGRNGKGIIYVFSSGNHFAFGADTNFAGRWQSRFIIYVGAVGKDGLHAQYSTPGASLMVVAPVGDRNDPLTIGTARTGGGCQKTGSGTSFASPIVSGVIALILEANPDLSWRDVQGILASTSQPVTHTIYNDDSQVVNGAGLVHSNLYGFGIIDAFAAVTAAQQWELYSDEIVRVQQSPVLDLTIGDDPNNPTIVQLLVEATEMIVENVEVVLYLEHLSRGHLQISLTSPRGTTSELTPGLRPENGQGTLDKPWRLLTVRSWGEAAQGVWTLSIVDLVEGDVSSCIDVGDWQVQGSDFLYDCALVEWFPELHEPEEKDWWKNLFAQNITSACCSCGGGTRNTTGCMDIGGFNETCTQAQSERICQNGTLVDDYALYNLKDDQGRTVWDACCIAGGGIAAENPDTFRDKLIRWELLVHGHATDFSSQPSEILTMSPTTVSPSSSPTLGGIKTPASEPTLNPSLESTPNKPPFDSESTNLAGSDASYSLRIRTWMHSSVVFFLIIIW